MAKTYDPADAQYKKMTESPIPGLVMSMAVPTVISSLVTSIYNMADTFFVAQIGTTATAAVGVVFSIQALVQAVGYGLGMGSGSLISRKLGAKENEAACMYASTAFAGAIIFGLLLLLIGIVNIDGMMKLVGATDTILPYARAYGLIILAGAPIMCSAFVLNAVLRFEGKARFSMIGLSIGSVLNIGLDPLFIFVFKMGVEGAAYATVLSQLLSFCILFSFFLRRKSIIGLSGGKVSRRPSTYGEIIMTGAPTVCRQGLASLATALLNTRVGMYGDAAVAAMSIANRVYMLLRSVIVGIGQGFMPVAGYNYGAKKYARVKESFKVTVLIGSAFSCGIAVILALGAPALMAVFRADDADVIQIGSLALRFMCLSLPLLGYSTYVNQLLQGLGKVKRATFLAACRQGIFFVPLILILPAVLGLPGAQMTQAASDLCTAAISIPFNYFFFKELDQMLKG